jgi:CO/xanthine dehydrogenase Mo-binding subunit
MMEPHATIAAWDGDKLTLWTANQMIAWGKGSIAKILGIPAENVRLDSPYIGGGFGGKLFIRADAVLAALGAKAARRPVKVALTRPADRQQHHPPAGHPPAHPDRGEPGRQDHGDRAREHLGQPARRQARRRRCRRRRCSTPARTASSPCGSPISTCPEGNAMRAPAKRRA